MSYVEGLIGQQRYLCMTRETVEALFPATGDLVGESDWESDSKHDQCYLLNSWPRLSHSAVEYDCAGGEDTNNRCDILWVTP